MSVSVNELIAQVKELPHGRQRVELSEHAVREADCVGDTKLSYQARVELVESATYAGCPDRALTAFSWCLSHFDANPQQFDSIEALTLLWQYKWIMGNLPLFPQVSRAQIAEMQDDLQRRFSQYDFSLRGVYVKRMSNAITMGDVEDAARQFELLRNSRRDLMADCEACERSAEIRLLITLGKDAEALEHAAPIVSGKMKCGTVPDTTYAMLLEPLMRTQQLELAKKYDRKGYRLASANAKYLREVADHLLYTVCQGKFPRAVRLFERHLPWAIESSDFQGCLWFYNSASILFEALVRNKGRARKIAVPDSLSCFREDNLYKPADLQEWLAAQEQQLVSQFDIRNGNEYYSELMTTRRQFALSC